MRHILVTGARGLLGSEFAERLQRTDNFFAGHADCDITDIQSIRKYVAGKKIDYILNCAADRNTEAMQVRPEAARKICVDGPENLAVVAKEIGAVLIHFSSDYVFDGKKSSPYTETDKTNGLSVYGALKAEGEQKVLAQADTALVIRTAWLFSSYGGDFVKTIKKLAESKNEIKVVFDQVGSPCYAGDLADAVLKILPQIPPHHREIYHLTNEGVCSWYDLAYQIVKGFGLDCRVLPIHTEEFLQKAPRPAYSVLDKTKVKEQFGVFLRHYSEGLEACISKIKGGL